MSNKSFNKLQKIWDKKLKDSGFVDIENKAGRLTRGKPRLNNKNASQIESIQIYYSMASSFLLDHEFKDEVERTVWMYHSEGLSTRDIADILTNQLQYEGWKKTKVIYTIKRLETLMKQRYLKP